MKKNLYIFLIFSFLLAGCSTIKKDLSYVKQCSSDYIYFVKAQECLKQQIHKSSIEDSDLKNIVYLYVETINKSINSKLIDNQTGWSFFNDHFELAARSKSKDEIHSAYVTINNAIIRLR